MSRNRGGCSLVNGGKVAPQWCESAITLVLALVGAMLPRRVIRSHHHDRGGAGCGTWFDGERGAGGCWHPADGDHGPQEKRATDQKTGDGVCPPEHGKCSSHTNGPIPPACTSPLL